MNEETKKEEYKEEKVKLVVTEVETGIEEEFEELPEIAIVAKEEQVVEREMAYNEDAIAEIEKDKKENKSACVPSFFIDEDETHDIRVDILSDKETGKIVSVSRADLVELDQFEFLHKSVETFTFSIPNYDDMTKYRQSCLKFSAQANREIIDNVQMRSFFLVWHLQDWSLRGKNGKKVELKHDENGSLTDESLAMVYRMPGSLLDVVLTIFEKDVLVS